MAVNAANPAPPNLPHRVGRDQVPPHVPADLIRETGLCFGPEFLSAPHDFMARMHSDLPPIYYDVSLMGNAWHLIRQEDAMFMLRHPEYFSNEGATPFPRDPDDYFHFIPIEIDPPHHRKYRSILDPVFSPQAVQKLDALIRQRANALIDEVIDKHECDFAEGFGRTLPVSVFLDLMGLPQDMRDTFVTWAVDLLHSHSHETMAKAMNAITAYMREVIELKRREPDDAVISRIVHAKPDGQPLSEKEVFGFVVFLFIGGLDTVFATLNNIWVWLAQNPDRRHEIINRPDDINSIVEELLRRWSVVFSGRSIAQDIEMRGVLMKKGDKAISILPAANFDPAVFPDPTRVDFNRPRKPILAFTLGVHSCMGAHLARLEIKIALQEWLRRIPDFSLRPGTKITYPPGGVIGPHHVPLVW